MPGGEFDIGEICPTVEEIGASHPMRGWRCFRGQRATPIIVVHCKTGLRNRREIKFTHVMQVGGGGR